MNDADRDAAATIRVLIVDNDPAHAQAMAESLEVVGYPCRIATSGPEGARLIEQESFDVVVTDLVMNDIDGMALLGLAKHTLPDAEVVMVTGHASVPKAVEAMQQGAFSFLEKPITANRLRAVTARAAEAVRLRRDNFELNRRLDERFGFEGIVFASDKMRAVIDRVKRVAPTDATVLITGDSGTGKELIAQAIHQNSPRKNKRVFPLNCAAFVENLVESELFGHVKGAYTDARTDRIGAFEYANGGTLFLDEIGDMPLATQTKLLRVLEQRVVTRVGDNKPIDVNVRVLSATKRNLEQAVETGLFREDLYYRLKVVTVEIPSLVDRREDVVPLMEHFRRQYARHHQKSIERFSPAVRRKFFEFNWPGNVRQLRNAVETMVVLDGDGMLDTDDLPPELLKTKQDAAPAVCGLDPLIGQPLEEYEKYAIEVTLKLTNGNREEAARMLGIGARTLYRKLEKFDIG
ncbi:MAG: sigma-54-dependent Fis family transcriptional regulator [Planctomycetes bacterium]|nr:sigma-54-dependent Fis family transcriptional regulator [Planctomycetota bacterium]